MDGATLQARIYGGYAKAATRIGYPYAVYRSSSMVNPIITGNRILTALYASFTTGFDFKSYSKPLAADCIAIVDGTQVQIGDWLIGQAGTFFIADMQPTLPITAIQCNRTVSIKRGAYTNSGAMEQTETVIASSFPVFARVARAKAKLPAGFPAQSETEAGIPTWEFYINNHTVGEILKNDVIVDENGDRYVIDSPDLTSFGFIVQAHIEKP